MEETYRNDLYLVSFKQKNFDFTLFLVHTRWTSDSEGTRGKEVRMFAEHLSWMSVFLKEKDIILAGNLNCSGTAKHVRVVTSRAQRVMDGCGFRFWSDISGSKVMAYLGDLRTSENISAQTFNFYLQAVKQFGRWMVKDGRASENPPAHLDGLNVKADRRFQRRAFTVEETRRLLGTTGREPTRFGMTGAERALIYRLAVETGLRAGEIRSLRRTSFDLEAREPTVTVLAA